MAPIFKKGEKYDAANYRSVSLTCICCKTLEHIIVSNINGHLAFESSIADLQMKFNVAKCHSMRVTRHPPDKHIQFDYKLHQQRLEQVQSAKYLGFTITDDLDWGQHISEISAKATKTLGFLKRNLAFAPRCIQNIGSP